MLQRRYQLGIRLEILCKQETSVKVIGNSIGIRTGYLQNKRAEFGRKVSYKRGRIKLSSLCIFLATRGCVLLYFSDVREKFGHAFALCGTR